MVLELKADGTANIFKEVNNNLIFFLCNGRTKTNIFELFFMIIAN